MASPTTASADQPDEKKDTGTKLRFLPDDPIADANDDKFGLHGAFADALKKLIDEAFGEADPKGFVIGISGPWGSGKSTIVELLRSRSGSRRDSGHRQPSVEPHPAGDGPGAERTVLPSQIPGNVRHGDCPCLQNDQSAPEADLTDLQRLRRFLRCSWACFIQFLRPVESETQDAPRCSCAERAVVVFDVSQFTDDSLRRWILSELELQLNEQGIAGFDRYEYNGRSLHENLERPEQMLTSRLYHRLSGAALFVLLPIAWYSVLHEAVTPTSTHGQAGLAGFLALALSVAAGVFAASIPQVTVTTNPAFSPEQFQRIFRDMVGTAAHVDGESKAKRTLILCFDNLDRVSGEVALEVLQTIKAFMGQKGCVCLLPCDQDALLNHLKGEFEKRMPSLNEGESRRLAEEYLQKYFNATLRLPEISSDDLRGYAEALATTAGFADNAGVGDVAAAAYGGMTPRQVKRFINDLSANEYLFRSLRQRRSLPQQIPEPPAAIAKLVAIWIRWPREFRILASSRDTADRWATAAASSGNDNPGIDSYLWQFLRDTSSVPLPTDPRIFLFLKTSVPGEEHLRPTLYEATRKDNYEQFRSVAENPAHATSAAIVIDELCETFRRENDKFTGTNMLRHLLRLRRDRLDIDVWVTAESLAVWLLTPPHPVTEVGRFDRQAEQLAELIANANSQNKGLLSNWVLGRLEALPTGDVESQALTDIAFAEGVLSEEQRVEAGRHLATAIHTGGGSKRAAIGVAARADEKGRLWPSAIPPIALAVLDSIRNQKRPPEPDEADLIGSIMSGADSEAKNRYAKALGETIRNRDEISAQRWKSVPGWSQPENLTPEGIQDLAHACVAMIVGIRERGVGMGVNVREMLIAALPLMQEDDLDAIDTELAALYRQRVDGLDDKQTVGIAAEYEFVEQYLPKSWKLIRSRLRGL